MLIAILIGVFCALLLAVAMIMDFVMAGKQKDKGDKNTLLAAGALTAIGSGVMLITIIVVSTHCMAQTVKAGAQAAGDFIEKNPELLAMLAA